MNMQKVANIFQNGYPLGMKYDVQKFLVMVGEMLVKYGSPEALAKPSGISASTIYNWVEGETIPRGSMIVRFCQKLDLPLPLSGKPPKPIKPVEIDGYTMVPFLDVELAAGDGPLAVLDPEVHSHLAFQTSWLRGVGSPAKMAVVRVMGDSMKHLIYDGDAVLVDTSQTEPLSGCVYAIFYEGRLRIKRVETGFFGYEEFDIACSEGRMHTLCEKVSERKMIPDKKDPDVLVPETDKEFTSRVWDEYYKPVALVSDNREQYPVEFFDHGRQCHIIGRAVWIGRDISHQ